MEFSASSGGIDEHHMMEALRKILDDTAKDTAEQSRVMELFEKKLDDTECLLMRRLASLEQRIDSCRQALRP